MNLMNPIDEIVTKKPLWALAGIVVIATVILTISILRPRVEGQANAGRSWLPNDDTLSSIFKLLFQSMSTK
jgi:hypothetical protein